MNEKKYEHIPYGMSILLDAPQRELNDFYNLMLEEMNPYFVGPRRPIPKRIWRERLRIYLNEELRYRIRSAWLVLRGKAYISDD